MILNWYYEPQSMPLYVYSSISSQELSGIYKNDTCKYMFINIKAYYLTLKIWHYCHSDTQIYYYI